MGSNAQTGLPCWTGSTGNWRSSHDGIAWLPQALMTCRVLADLGSMLELSLEPSCYGTEWHQSVIWRASCALLDCLMAFTQNRGPATRMLMHAAVTKTLRDALLFNQWAS
jgi:hypothetical protein